MNKLVSIFWFVLLTSSQSLFAQVKKASYQTCHLYFHTSVNGVPFSFDSTYQNHSGEVFKVRRFTYYISHLRFVYDDGKTVTASISPRLINETDSSSKHIVITAPTGKITGIRFLLGIDSITNVSGVQSGDLDPAKGMFWVWNTGYIMAKLEGSSPASKAPGKQYSYDIGGFKPGENVTKEISLSIGVSNQQSAISHQLPAASHQPSTFIITADIGKWFYGSTELKIAEQAMCHSPGKLAMQVADNYAAMFSISTE